MVKFDLKISTSVLLLAVQQQIAAQNPEFIEIQNTINLNMQPKWIRDLPFADKFFASPNGQATFLNDEDRQTLIKAMRKQYNDQDGPRAIEVNQVAGTASAKVWDHVSEVFYNNGELFIIPYNDEISWLMDDQECPANNPNCYKAEKSKQKAEAYCNALGATMYTPHSTAEYTAITQMCTESSVISSDDRFWIGIEGAGQANADGDFVYTTKDLYFQTNPDNVAEITTDPGSGICNLSLAQNVTYAKMTPNQDQCKDTIQTGNDDIKPEDLGNFFTAESYGDEAKKCWKDNAMPEKFQNFKNSKINLQGFDTKTYTCVVLQCDVNKKIPAWETYQCTSNNVRPLCRLPLWTCNDHFECNPNSNYCGALSGQYHGFRILPEVQDEMSKANINFSAFMANKDTKLIKTTAYGGPDNANYEAYNANLDHKDCPCTDCPEVQPHIELNQLADFNNKEQWQCKNLNDQLAPNAAYLAWFEANNNIETECREELIANSHTKHNFYVPSKAGVSANVQQLLLQERTTAAGVRQSFHLDLCDSIVCDRSDLINAINAANIPSISSTFAVTQLFNNVNQDFYTVTADPITLPCQGCYDGSITLDCSASNFVVTGGSCQPKLCNRVIADQPSNTVITYPNVLTCGTSVQLSCSPGFFTTRVIDNQVTTVSSKICNAEASLNLVGGDNWSSVNCLRRCTNPAVWNTISGNAFPNFATPIPPAGEIFLENDTVTVSCPAGYQVSGSGNASIDRRCVNGVFPETICVEQQCSAASLPVLENGYCQSTKADGSQLDTGDVFCRCNSGFTMFGNSCPARGMLSQKTIPICSKAVFEIDAAIVCRPTICTDSPDLPNGVRILDANNRHESAVDSNVEYSCGYLYEPENGQNPVATCTRNDGYFNAVSGACVKTTCELSDLPTNVPNTEGFMLFPSDITTYHSNIISDEDLATVIDLNNRDTVTAGQVGDAVVMECLDDHVARQLPYVQYWNRTSSVLLDSEAAMPAEIVDRGLNLAENRFAANPKLRIVCKDDGAWSLPAYECVCSDEIREASGANNIIQSTLPLEKGPFFLVDFFRCFRFLGPS